MLQVPRLQLRWIRRTFPDGLVFLRNQKNDEALQPGMFYVSDNMATSVEMASAMGR